MLDKPRNANVRLRSSTMRLLLATTLLAAFNGSVHGEDDASAAACEPEGYQLDMLERVNEARATRRSCGGESYAVAGPLTYSCTLEKAARSHSEDMAAGAFLSHTGSDDSSVSQRVDATGYAWRAVGENIASGNVSIAVIFEGWLASAGHCANIMNPKFEEFGAARAESSADDGGNYWTQVFAKPR
ncbi:CAP domain-containing protein [Marinobacter fonticola]|uniref:CAP domain-containing protein n=1 Tax=Marinobacter fonticola TaxID=2603215 RepID=UPI0011E816DC|nr:CAP domain-containing protein [Marinobacter fonticola]